MEYYSALKRKEIVTHAIAWMNLEDIMLSEISQSQKDKHYMIPIHVRYLQESESERQKVERWLPGAGGRGWGVSASWAE